MCWNDHVLVIASIKALRFWIQFLLYHSQIRLSILSSIRSQYPATRSQHSTTNPNNKRSKSSLEKMGLPMYRSPTREENSSPEPGSPVERRERGRSIDRRSEAETVLINRMSEQDDSSMESSRDLEAEVWDFRDQGCSVHDIQDLFELCGDLVQLQWIRDVLERGRIPGSEVRDRFNPADIDDLIDIIQNMFRERHSIAEIDVHIYNEGYHLEIDWIRHIANGGS